jgi:hypothetical protein
MARPGKHSRRAILRVAACCSLSGRAALSGVCPMRIAPCSASLPRGGAALRHGGRDSRRFGAVSGAPSLPHVWVIAQRYECSRCFTRTTLRQ